MAKFDWDPRKDAANQQKHGIGFDRAREVFSDPDAIRYPGGTRNGESRFLIVGKVLGTFIIAVVYTLRNTVFRIISARQAQKKEIKDYIVTKYSADGNEGKHHH
ncbi:MAG: BrnT family toxin [Lewinellaceae bacterium]|nr:BrnT family toxin [Lewinellaceae bacterium]